MKEVIPIVAQAEAVRPLAELAERIHQAYLESEDAGELHLRYAIEAGQWLNQAKKQVKHGEWGNWLKAHVKFSHETANLYMRLDREREQVMANSQRVTNLTLREAIRLLDGSPLETPTERPTAPPATPGSSAPAPSASNGASDPARTSRSAGASSNASPYSSAPARPRQPDPDEEEDDEYEDDTPPTQEESEAVAGQWQGSPAAPSGKPWHEKAKEHLGGLVRALSAAELYEKHRLALEAIHADILGARA
jgi:hypothetical protein